MSKEGARWEGNVAELNNGAEEKGGGEKSRRKRKAEGDGGQSGPKLSASVSGVLRPATSWATLSVRTSEPSGRCRPCSSSPSTLTSQLTSTLFPSGFRTNTRLSLRSRRWPHADLATPTHASYPLPCCERTLEAGGQEVTGGGAEADGWQIW